MLTDKQRQQIRIMVSHNPTIGNMARVANLSDVEVLAELDSFKITELEQLQQNKINMLQENSSITDRLNKINELIEILTD